MGESLRVKVPYGGWQYQLQSGPHFICGDLLTLTFRRQQRSPHRLQQERVDIGYDGSKVYQTVGSTDLYTAGLQLVHDLVIPLNGISVLQGDVLPGGTATVCAQVYNEV